MVVSPERLLKLNSMLNKFSFLFLLGICTLFSYCSEDTEPDVVTFTVIGDVPYSNGQRSSLIEKIELHDSLSSASFVVHVGDIKSGQDPCDESVYQDVSNILKEFETPTFIILGDNEYNDCDDPDQARAYWDQYFLNLHEQWNFDQAVETPPSRTENWAWFQDDILFVGLNIVGSKVHDSDEWESRLSDNAVWLRSRYQQHVDEVAAIVIFGHANMVDFGAGKFETFTTEMINIATEFNKPMVYIQGDGHNWIDDTPWAPSNLRRIQIEGGKIFMDVKVDSKQISPFEFIRDAY